MPSDNVRMLCERMRELQDFQALPILADAIEEDGNAELAAKCRVGGDWAECATLVARAMGGEALEAMNWLEEFADDVKRPYWFGEEEPDLPEPDREWDRQNRAQIEAHNVLDLRVLLGLLKANYDGDDDYFTFWGFRTPDRCHEDREKMWRMFYEATGLPEKRVINDSPFSCSC